MVMHYGYNSYDWSLFNVNSALQIMSPLYLVTLRLLCKNDYIYLLYHHDNTVKILDIIQTKIKYCFKNITTRTYTHILLKLL